MKPLALFSVLPLLALIAWRFASPGPAPATATKAEPDAKPTSTLTDATVVFQKAFWKRPNANDRILHAERREWADADGVKKWQWFIEVEPSAELLRHLITDNAFSLGVARDGWPTLAAGTPDWFTQPSSQPRVLQSRSGSFVLVHDEKANRLLATDSGGGFRPGAPERPSPAPTPSVAAGRLPPTSPPNPPKP